MQTNVLHYGDNLDILRRYLPETCVDLVELDPPFNSNRDDNVIFRDESGNATDAQLLAFEDTWHAQSIGRGDLLMEPQTGVFMSSLPTDAWEPDPDVGGLMHILCDVPGVWAGFTRYDTDPPPVSWTPPQRETFMVLESAARIEIAGGVTLDLAAGGIASLPAGTETTWHITAPFREFWVLSGPSFEPEGSQHMDTNVLYYGDNLDILRRYLPDAAVDLVYPPLSGTNAEA